MGLVVGVLTSILPDLTSVLVPIIIGALLAVSGLNFLTRAKASSGRRKTVFYAVSVLLIVFALAVMLNIVDSGKTVRIIAGTAMAVTGFYNFFLERSAKSEEISDIIDVNDFTVKRRQQVHKVISPMRATAYKSQINKLLAKISTLMSGDAVP